MLRRLALSGARAAAGRPCSAHMAVTAPARLASGSSRVPGSSGATGVDARKPARSAAPTRSEDDFADEDLTAVPQVPARETAPRAVPRPGSATAWRQPMFAATTSDAAQRAAFSAGRGGPEVEDDMATIQRDVSRVSQLDASSSQARASASAGSAATGSKTGRAPKSVTGAARRGAADRAGGFDPDEMFYDGAAGAGAGGFDDLDDYEDLAAPHEDDITQMALEVYGDRLVPAVPGRRAAGGAAVAPRRALPQSGAPARSRRYADDEDDDAGLSDLEKSSRPSSFGADGEGDESLSDSGPAGSGSDGSTPVEADDSDDLPADPAARQAAMKEIVEEMLNQQAAQAAAAGTPWSEAMRAKLRKEALQTVEAENWTAGDSDEEDLDEDDAPGRASGLEYTGAAEDDPAVQEELELMDNMLRNKRAEATAKVFGKPAALEEAEDTFAQEIAVREAISAAAAEGPALSAQGLSVDYCIFCYHGTSFMRHDNMAMLTHFVSEGGAILPKRFTKCCSKHQRKLAATIKRARWLNLVPWHSKLHPKLRFSSLKPEPLGAVAATPSAKGGAPGVAGAAPLSSLDRRGIGAAVDEINKLAQAP